MEKVKYRKNIGKEKEINADNLYGDITPIDEVIEFFVKAKENGATHFSCYAISDRDGNSEYCKVQPFYECEETENKQ